MDEQILTLHKTLALDRLEDFVRQAEARGVELASGSDLAQALALLIANSTATAGLSNSATAQQTSL